MSRTRNSTRKGFIQNLFGAKSKQDKRTRRQAKTATFHPMMETLERRDCPAGVSAYLSGGILTVTGTDAVDTITIQEYVAKTYSLTSPGAKITVNGQAFASWGVNKIVVHGLGSGDIIRNNTSKDSVIYGDNGPDTIYGGWGSDEIHGGTNDDTLFGGDNNDFLYGDQGSDHLYGGVGTDGGEAGDTRDFLWGGDGPDYLYGGYGDDTLIGGNDNDWIQGQWANDLIVGGNWNFLTMTSQPEIATVWGYTTNDTLFGENGYDTIYGGDGNDYISGGWESDTLYGEDGYDRMWGAFQNSETQRPGTINSDRLYGGDKDDQLWGGDGDDWLYGESGNDTLDGQSGNDALEGDTGNDVLKGGAGNDNLVGSEELDWLYGGTGDDSLWGAEWQNNYQYDDAANYLFGEGDNDNLYGGNGRDYMDGGSGDDGLFGGVGYNTLIGGADDDRFLTYSDLIINLSLDDIQDADSRDAILHFTSDFGSFKRWTDAEVAAVDGGLAWLHHVTNNTSLLKLSSGADVTFARFVSDGTSLADNDSDGTIRVFDSCFTDTDPAGQTIIHEMGHNWDQASENESITTFRDLSGWTALALDEDVPDGYTRAMDLDGIPQPWIYASTAEFTWDYGRTDPREDFAVCLEMYYKGYPASVWQSKWDFIDQFIRSESDS